MFTRIQSLFIKVRNNNFFEGFVLTIILISALNVGISTYDNIPKYYTDILEYLDYSVTVFFLIEIIIRIVAEKSLRKFFKSGWNVFDFVIVAASLIPTSYFESVLVLRLIRLFRILRLISIFPQFRVLIESLVKAIPRVGYVILFMFINFLTIRLSCRPYRGLKPISRSKNSRFTLVLY